MKKTKGGNVGLNDHSIAGGSYGAACKKNNYIDTISTIFDVYAAVTTSGGEMFTF